jgi:TrmH family RNA methyltransferase
MRPGKPAAAKTQRKRQQSCRAPRKSRLEDGATKCARDNVDRFARSNPYCGVAQRAEFDRLCVVLVATRNPLNIGAAARAMSNFGFCNLRVVNSYDPSFREARSAVGASSLLANAEEFKTVAEAVADCTLVVGTTSVGPRKPEQPVRRLQEGARFIRKRLASSRVALLFGSEKVGLSNEDFSHCHWLLRIPTRVEHRSMNLGQAVAVSLYEIARDPAVAARSQKYKPANAGQLERLVSVLLDGLATAGYAHLNAKPLTEEKLRRLVCRLQLSADDSEVLLGMLRQIVWKLHSTTDAKP